MRRNWKRFLLILLATSAVCGLMTIIIKPNDYQPNAASSNWLKPNVIGESTKELAWKRFGKAELSKLSKLGRILYGDEPYPPNRTNNDKVYEILVWKYGPRLEARHLKQFGNNKIDPFETCSIKNCRITYSDSALATADLVLFHLHQLQLSELPKRTNQTQIWTFLTDESPLHTFLKRQNLTAYNGLFNWSMSYRKDSDIPVPYGRTVMLGSDTTVKADAPSTAEPPKRRDALAAILGSNCGGQNHRWPYVRELQRHMQVDVYGACGALKCAGHFKRDCARIGEYLFYLAFENSNCDEYVTEKLWWNAYAKGAIPVVMGARREDYERMLPPNSYINVADFARPKDLADYLLYLNRTRTYGQYYDWRKEYRVLNEHGYFGSRSYHYCRVCEALNYNDRGAKVYEKLDAFWSKERDCHPAWDE